MINKICPLMSSAATYSEAGQFIDGGEVLCKGNECQFWIEVYTTELHRHEGCAIALQPQMVDGQFRV